MTIADQLKWIYKEYAIDTNPYGYYPDPTSTPPATLEQLRSLHKYFDDQQKPLPIRYTQYAVADWLTDYFAWHDRVHVIHNFQLRTYHEIHVIAVSYTHLRAHETP